MIIGIDIDDTIADTYEVLFNYAQDYTINVLKKEPNIYEVSCGTHLYIETLHGWNEEESEEFWRLYLGRIIENAKPKTLALEYLQKLKKQENKIVLITARWQPEGYDINVEEETKKWIEKNNIPCDKLIINAFEKDKIAMKENVDVFIDDSFKNCQAVSNIGIKSYMMDTRVNRELNRDDIERVYSWSHVYMKLKN